MGDEVKITTVERNEAMIERAKENIKRAGFENNITILEGDAEELLPKVEGEFDMIFLDAAKGQYKLFYDMVIDKLKVGGLLISDNILYKGMVAHDDFVVRRKKTIVKRMRNYLDYICNCEYLSTSLIPLLLLMFLNPLRGLEVQLLLSFYSAPLSFSFYLFLSIFYV